MGKITGKGRMNMNNEQSQAKARVAARGLAIDALLTLDRNSLSTLEIGFDAGVQFARGQMIQEKTEDVS